MGGAAFFGFVFLLFFGFCCFSVGLVGIFKPIQTKYFHIKSRPRASLWVAVGLLCLIGGAFLKVELDRTEQRVAAAKQVEELLRTSHINRLPCKIIVGSWKVDGSSIGLILHFDVDRSGRLMGAVSSFVIKKTWSKTDCQRDGKFMMVKTKVPKKITTVFKIISPSELQVISMSLDGVVKINQGRNIANGMATYPIVKIAM